MTKEKINNKVDSPFNTTITEEQFSNMTKDDMMIAIYNCMKVMGMDKEDAVSVSHQLLRILLRILNRHKINLKTLLYEVLLDETASRMSNQDEKLDDLEIRTADEMYLWIRELVV
jgi:hypothetical protein